MTLVPVLGLAVPLPAIIMAGVTLYMLVLALVLWIRFCLKERCPPLCGSCCPDFSVWDQCFRLAQSCDCRLPTLRSCLMDAGSPPSVRDGAKHHTLQGCGFILTKVSEDGGWCLCLQCSSWDCACTCQPPECESCNCLCFEIRIK
ncbi:uncharacterized protein si:ch211-198p11.6 isoform X1 [Syngnathus typhle]|uniref:uncharacterized protein si:ch211-198p11.6 isoform X1 n=1 Tax=Syngnathus typhle TaxID=161592 RepID=UPI002A69B0C2|nr:uncharacterized protein si:ch211-198p11.6 isoform X1 [Syngnathus typhle]XP_061159098.1 uncharacterized protein si:ch211-198p11.6 isoform X1 [Syngnathus typhle]XP_061159099.1 uncharacterized protein si:ch211-198p11.6 isoform X1 [Syngnathus typhle]XP_061159100.1 uncharacterized protein si:ch211-198p11.6 isoform X1 [Syngnathus typhle]XP_061159101.1 uncharacterized protein si:ch211-198p11.6 isoform X1 [Syngnathus typhle]